jgi:hypothetical protein
MMSGTTGSGSPGQELVARLRDSSRKPSEIARFLDDLSHEERVGSVRALGRPEQRRLYETVEGFASVRLVDLVPPSRADFQEVRHYGKNTLPLFTIFEKRFCRAGGHDPESPGELHGYNFQTLTPLTGPGYFVAVEDEKRAEVLVDYRRVPDRRPETWPEIKPNDRGLSRFIYGFMVDTLRRVSEHVTIGSAARNGKDLGSWFVLCREA